MKTRAKSSSKSSKTAAQADESTKSTEPKIQLAPESSDPPKLFILPKDLSQEARIVALQNPRYAVESRYVICPEKGFFEFTKAAAPKTTPRSLLLCGDPNPTSVGEENTKDENVKFDVGNYTGYITREAALYIATAIDPLFIILPALHLRPSSKQSETPKKLFLSGYDYLERIKTTSPQFGSFSRCESIQKLLEKRMAAVCDSVEAGGESMYRLNEEKLLEELFKKAKKMVKNGLPPSMEEKFVRKALEAPMLSVKREESSTQELVKGEESATETENSTPAVATPDTQTTVSSTSTATGSFSEASTAATSFSGESIDTPIEEKAEILPTTAVPEGVTDLLRLRTALFFICSSYLAPHISESLKKHLSTKTTTIDFAPLDAYLAHLAKLRQEALALRSLGDYSKKRGMFEDEDEEGGRAAKKRKKEEEEKRKKAGESRGVKNLKKVNTSGMKKMSDFFKKA